MSDRVDVPMVSGMASDAVEYGTPVVPPKRATRPVLVVSLILMLLIGAAIGWRIWSTSPTYSLWQLAKAVESNDWDGVQKYVDVEAVLSQVIDVAVGQAVEEDDSGFGALAAGFAQALKPGLVQQAKDELRKGVEEGDSSSKGDTSLSGYFGAKKIKSVTRIGSEALVTIVVPDDGKTFDLKLKMKRVDDFWRITAIENVADLPLTSGN